MRVLVILVLVLVTGAAACAEPVATGGTPSSPSEPSMDPIGNSDDPAGTRPALPAARVVREGVQDARPRPFEEALVDETDGTFHVLYSTGVEPCYVLGDVQVEESDDQVTVTLFEGYVADEEGDAPTCIEIAENVSVEVTLAAALDDRVVVDGATGEEVPVTVISAADAPRS